MIMASSASSMGDISREEFLNDNQEIQQEMDALASQINDIQTQKEETKSSVLDIEQIRQTLSQWVDFSGPVISEELVDQFVLQVVAADDNTYNFFLPIAKSVCGPVRSRCKHIERSNRRFR